MKLTKSWTGLCFIGILTLKMGATGSFLLLQVRVGLGKNGYLDIIMTRLERYLSQEVDT